MPIAELNTPPIQEPILQVDLFPSPVDQPLLAGLKVTRPWAQFLEYIAQKVAAASSSTTADGYYNASIVANQVAIAISNGRNQRIVLNQATRVTIMNPTGAVAGDWLLLLIEQDATGYRPDPAWDTDYGASITALRIAGDASTYSAYRILYNGTTWAITSFIVGQPV